MIIDTIGYGYKDLTVIPASHSEQEHRADVWPFIKLDYDTSHQVKHPMLPIFTAPMSTVVNIENYTKFYDNNIFAIIPRNIDISTRIDYMVTGNWVAFSMSEIKKIISFLSESHEDVVNIVHKFGNHFRICIDIANGHLESIYNCCRNVKLFAQKEGLIIEIMTGNIANPDTYYELAYTDFGLIDKTDKNSGKIVDYIRLGIGSGEGCITSPQTAIHYPMATLIDMCNKFDLLNNIDPVNRSIKLIADGGIKSNGDVIKALALGANYVMIGGLFARTVDAAGDKYIIKGNDRIKIEQWQAEQLFEENSYWKYDPKIYDEEDNERSGYSITRDNLYTEFYGMASRQGQIDMFGKKMKTAEGIYKFLHVETSLQKWSKNMEDSIRSAMTYCNCWNLSDFVGKQKLIPNAEGEKESVNK